MPTPSNRTTMGTGRLPGTVGTGPIQPLYGKYRGRVSSTNDPTMRGRIKAIVPFPFGPVETAWAEPSFAPGEFNPPSIGDGVWIEFEMGDRDLPIWSGCWLRQGEAPFQAPSNALQLHDEEATTTPEEDYDHAGFHDHRTAWYSPHLRCWRSPTGHYILFDDWQNADGSEGNGRVTIATRNGLRIELREEGQVEIFAGDMAYLSLDSDQQRVSVQAGQTTVELDGAAKTVAVTTDKEVTVDADTVSLRAATNVYLGDDPDSGDPLQLMTQADATAIRTQMDALRTYIAGHKHDTPGVASGGAVGHSNIPTSPPDPIAYEPILTMKTRGT